MNLLKFTWSRAISCALLSLTIYLSGYDRSIHQQTSSKMVAIIAHLAKIYENMFVRSSSSSSALFSNPKIPQPSILHKVLDDDFLSKFDDVLIVSFV